MPYTSVFNNRSFFTYIYKNVLKSRIYISYYISTYNILFIYTYIYIYIYIKKLLSTRKLNFMYRNKREK